MTVRDFVKKILEEAPRLDAEIYLITRDGDIDCIDYNIVNIANEGTNDTVFIDIKELTY